MILVVALLVLGPQRLPEVARALGKGLAEFRRLTSDVNHELSTARDIIENEARQHEVVRRKVDRKRVISEAAERALAEKPKQPGEGLPIAIAASPTDSVDIAGARPETAPIADPGILPADEPPQSS